jgi:arsenate reductase
VRGVEDPAAVEGSDDVTRRAFIRALRELDARIKIFTSLQLDKLDRLSLQRELDKIGATRAGREEEDRRVSRGERER